MPKFLIKTGKYQGKKLKLPERDVIVGRDLNCEIRVSDSDVSRQHCRLTLREGKLFATDLESRNGTYINDVAIELETEMKPGDQLRVGPMVFELLGARKTIKKPTNFEPDQAAPLSDDDITGWLSEEAPEEETSTAGDTTIIPTSNIPPVETSPNPPQPQEKKEFHSVAEEAAEIIRQHWERVAQQQQQEKK